VISDRVVLELNRLVAITAELSIRYERVDPETVLLTARQNTYMGASPDYEEVIDGALEIGLLIRGYEGSLGVTELGDQLMTLNPSGYYELQPAQLPLLFRHVVAEGPLRPAFGELLQSLSTDPNSGSLFIRSEVLRSLSPRCAGCFDILRQLEVVDSADDVWFVTPNYLREFGVVRGEQRMTEQRLKQILEDQARFGLAAEQLAVEYERARLLALGASVQAAHVRRISDSDVGAGYDVESFDDGSTTKPNRFVEVKASSSRYLRFFWTRNEYLTARRLAQSYYIYYAGAFNPQAGLAGFKPRIIADPVHSLPEIPTVEIEPQTILVTERTRTRAVRVEGFADLIKLGP